MPTPSGPAWCAQFPTSASLDDLVPTFRAGVANFIGALHTAGAHVAIAATYRPPERAYLMHWSCMIAGYKDKNTGHTVVVPAAQATPMAGIDIDWTHGGDAQAAKAAAAAMVAGYGIVYPAVLVSRHTERRAIDMTITWTGILQAKDAHGQIHGIPVTHTNSSNPGLIALGATYGVIKLVSDAPHWSDDGH